MALAKLFHSILNSIPQKVEVLVLIKQRFFWRAAALCDLVSQFNHLVHRLLARQARNKLTDDRSQIGFTLAGLQFGKMFHHHGDHHINPA